MKSYLSLFAFFALTTQPAWAGVGILDRSSLPAASKTFFAPRSDQSTGHATYASSTSGGATYENTTTQIKSAGLGLGYDHAFEKGSIDALYATLSAEESYTVDLDSSYDVFGLSVSGKAAFKAEQTQLGGQLVYGLRQDDWLNVRFASVSEKHTLDASLFFTDFPSAGTLYSATGSASHNFFEVSAAYNAQIAANLRAALAYAPEVSSETKFDGDYQETSSKAGRGAQTQLGLAYQVEAFSLGVDLVQQAKSEAAASKGRSGFALGLQWLPSEGQALDVEIVSTSNTDYQSYGADSTSLDWSLQYSIPLGSGHFLAGYGNSATTYDTQTASSADDELERVELSLWKLGVALPF